jgi:CHASE3 domain sensor protein
VAVKKQIVEASLKAFGFEIDKILLAANNQKRALDAYVKVNETSTAKAIDDAQKQIQSLTEKIAGLRTDIEKRTHTLSSVTQSAQTRKADVQKVIDFFQTPQA